MNHPYRVAEEVVKQEPEELCSICLQHPCRGSTRGEPCESMSMSLTWSLVAVGILFALLAEILR
jgi:hypothetical protein